MSDKSHLELFRIQDLSKFVDLVAARAVKVYVDPFNTKSRHINIMMEVTPVALFNALQQSPFYAFWADMSSKYAVYIDSFER